MLLKRKKNDGYQRLVNETNTENSDRETKTKRKWPWNSKRRLSGEESIGRSFTFRVKGNPDFVIKARFEDITFTPVEGKPAKSAVFDTLEMIKFIDMTTYSGKPTGIQKKTGQLEYNGTWSKQELVFHLDDMLKDDLLMKINCVTTNGSLTEFVVITAKRGGMTRRKIIGLPTNEN